MSRVGSVAVAGALLALASCSKSPEVRSFGGPTMGSTYQLKYVADAEPAALRAIVARVLQSFDEAFSNWRDDSEIARMNAHASTEPIEVSARFAAVLELALRVAEATDGAFDPTAKPLADVFRRFKEGAAATLDEDALQRARSLVDHRAVRLVDGQLVKRRPDVVLDLDGIVAGAAADAIGAALVEAGVTSFYLEVTGEVLCRGVKPGGEPWRIGVVDPASDVAGGQTAIRTVELRDRALCSSGDYRNVVVRDGAVVHHVFDPRTGRNPTHRTASASVIAASCAVADALGTALMVLGPDEARSRWPELRQLGAEAALMLIPTDDRNFRQEEIEWPAEDS